ncbi:MAG: hypothetical protein WA103_01025 [Minisyncoccales bacterium]
MPETKPPEWLIKKALEIFREKALEDFLKGFLIGQMIGYEQGYNDAMETSYNDD